MKITGILLIVLSVLGLGYWIWSAVYAHYQWDNEVASNWSLADKASTIPAKADYIDKFVKALQSSNLADNNALIYKTADNNCSNNIEAVSTLKSRLDEIKGMDVSSFQYQQAIQQITAQEQGEADKLMTTLSGCWYKTHHYFIWNPWYFGLFALLLVTGMVFGIAMVVYEN